MYIDRAQKIDIVGNKFKAIDLDSMDIYLDEDDINSLASTSLGYTTDRFMGCTTKGSVSGWAPEDKIHINLEAPVDPEDYNRFVDLSLDPGGDLYFTIWNSWALRSSCVHEEFRVDESFVKADPCNKLGQVGIRAVRLHNLPDLAARLGET